MILPLLISGCFLKPAPQIVVQDKLVYPHIPEPFFEAPLIEPIPNQEITILQGLELAGKLRLQICILRGRYDRLLQLVSAGKNKLPKVSNDVCPEN